MKKLFAVCLLALLLCSVTIPAFAVTEPVEATTEATEPTIRRGRPTNPYPKDPLPFYAPNRPQPVKPTAPPQQETVEPTKYNGPAIIPPQPDPEIDYLPMILIGSGVVVIGISVAVLLVSRKKSK